MTKIKINYFSHVSELLRERNKLSATTKPQNSVSPHIQLFIGDNLRTKNHLFYDGIKDNKKLSNVCFYRF